MISAKKKLLIASFVAVSGMTGCFDDDDSSGTSGPSTISGVASKGAVVGSTCTVPLVGGGTLTATTEADGAFAFNVAAGQSVAYPLVVVCAGGSYFDEKTGTTIDVDDTRPFKSVIPTKALQPSRVAVTPFTTLAAELFDKSDGSSEAASQALDSVRTALAPGLGSSGQDLLTAPTPVNSATSTLGSDFASEYAAYNASFSYLADANTNTNAVLGSLIDSIRSTATGGTVSFDPNISQNIVASTNDYISDNEQATGNSNAELSGNVSNDSSGSGSTPTPAGSGGDSNNTGGNGTQ